ncbi:Peregrin [Dactylellina cionopaga]|nr:Peregrin [Dactylellina cionopaga]
MSLRCELTAYSLGEESGSVTTACPFRYPSLHRPRQGLVFGWFAQFKVGLNEIKSRSMQGTSEAEAESGFLATKEGGSQRHQRRQNHRFNGWKPSKTSTASYDTSAILYALDNPPIPPLVASRQSSKHIHRLRIPSGQFHLAMASNSTPHRTPGTGRPRGRPRGSRSRPSFATPGSVLRIRQSSSSHRPNRSSRAQQTSTTDPGAYKPREERSYTEFHPDFDIEADVQSYDSREIDGSPNGQLPTGVSTSTPGKSNGIQIRIEEVQDEPSAASTPMPSTNGASVADSTTETNGAEPSETSKQGAGSSKGDDESQASSSHETHEQTPNPAMNTPTRRSSRQKDNKEKEKEKFSLTPKPPSQRPMLPMSNIHHNERLSLPVPSYKTITPFQLAETYVDRAMAGVGFQETDYWAKPNTMVRNIGIQDDINEGEARISSVAEDNEEGNTATHTITPGNVEYDMDEQDDKWLTQFNNLRRSQDVPMITREIFEITITKIEKEWYALEKLIPKQSAHAAHVKKGNDDDDEDTSEDSKCQICDDGECENSNAIVFCDGCNIAVHQDCYGVPFIPEGQWLCRRCSLLAPRRENCIFCPNTDGAFKMTDSALWSHLLCAIWIPEVAISNMVYMEPVEGVDLVPKSRWKLHCYICKQRMGACIQCSNKNCYLAFHVTCARKAKLFLSMRQQVPTDPSGATAVGSERSLIFDGSQLKAFCDKHVPSEWRKEYRTDIAIRNVQQYYEDAFYDKEWGDSQYKAITGTSGFGHDHGTPSVPKITLTVGGKRKRPSGGTGNKTIWRLPSGAPVIPQVLYNTIIEAISRFSIRKPKEYVAEICKYWTLKRESRRDASLLKRLQISASANFTSDEVTKKDYSAMYDGEEKLKRRLDFAIKLRHDLERIRLLADDIKKREKEKLRQAECLKEMIDAVYFPVIPILSPILDRAQQLDSKDFFKVEFGQIKQKLSDRQYYTVSQFSRDILSVLTSSVTSRSKFAVVSIPDAPESSLSESGAGTLTAAATPAAVHTANPLENLAPIPVAAVHSTTPKPSKALGDTAGKTAGRILRVIQPMLENAKLQELAMREDPNERMAGEVDERYHEILLERKKRDEEVQAQLAVANAATGDVIATDDTGVDRMDIDNPITSEQQEANDRAAEAALESATATLSQSHLKEDELDLIGIPWYTKPFSPMGATLLSEERWMGMDVVRDMSPLSELDEDAIEMLQRSETPEVVSPMADDDGGGGGASSVGGRSNGSGTKGKNPNRYSAVAGAWIPGTRVSLRTTKGTKRVSYLDAQQQQQLEEQERQEQLQIQQAQIVETPKPKPNGRTGSREVELQQVVVIGSTRSQTKQAIHKAQRRGRGYVWIPTASEANPTGSGNEVMNGFDDEIGSIDSPLTSVPDDPLDLDDDLDDDDLSLDSAEIEGLEGVEGEEHGDVTLNATDINGLQRQAIARPNEDNMETEITNTEFHTPLESVSAPTGRDEEKSVLRAATELIDGANAADQLSKEQTLAAVVAQEPNPSTEASSNSPGKRSTKNSPRQKDNHGGPEAQPTDIQSPTEDVKFDIDQQMNNGNGSAGTTPKKSPSVTSKGKDGVVFTPLPMTTRSRKTLEPETTPTRRGSSRSAVVARKR